MRETPRDKHHAFGTDLVDRVSDTYLHPATFDEDGLVDRMNVQRGSVPRSGHLVDEVQVPNRSPRLIPGSNTNASREPGR